MPTLTVYRTTFLDYDENGEMIDPSTDEETVDCTPDEYDREDGLTAVDLAVKFLGDEGITALSTSPVPETGSMQGDWFSYVDGSYVTNYHTGEREETSAHPHDFTDDELRQVAKLAAR